MDPGRIMQVGMGFFASKTLLSAVELGVFTELAARPATADELGERLGIHQRARRDFLDGLVALGFLERDGDGERDLLERRRQRPFLDRNKPTYIGGILEMANARLYPFWADLTEALQTGAPAERDQAHRPAGMFEELYAEPERLEQFMHAMSGISAGNFHALAEKFDFSRYPTLCDVGGATGQLSIIVAQRHPHMRCTTCDLPVVRPIARARHRRGGGRAIGSAPPTCDFFAEPIPAADVVTMGMILHDWNLERKQHLIRAAYDALPDGRRVHRRREPDRRRAARERVRPDDVAEHAHRVRRRLRLHGRGLRRVVS